MLIGKYFVEHVNCTGLQMKGILQILAVLLFFFRVKAVLDLYQLARLLLEQRNKLLDLLFTPHQPPHFADSFGGFLVGLDGQLDCSHVGF